MTPTTLDDSVLHLDYAAEALTELYAARDAIRGLRFVSRPASLAQFVATFAPV